MLQRETNRVERSKGKLRCLAFFRNQSRCTFENLQSVVDAINDIVSRGLQGSETRFVLLDDILFLVGKSRDLVHVADRAVGSVGGNLAGNIGVHAGKLEVDTDVGVVDINGVGTSQVSNIFVVTDGQGSARDGQTSGGSNSGRQEFTALGSQGSRRTVGRRSHKGGNGAVRNDDTERSGSRCENWSVDKWFADSRPPPNLEGIVLQPITALPNPNSDPATLFCRQSYHFYL